MLATPTNPLARRTASQLARWTLAAFVLTFLLARIVVLLIMTRRMPDLFLHVGQTHVHHLNYGIFLLVALGAWLLFAPPATGHGYSCAALIYGVGLALTFDEFGMWLHLGGSYWQRASYDAVVIVAALLTLLVSAPRLRHFRFRHWALAAAIVAVLGLFAALAVEHLQKTGSELKRIEQQGPR
jgi:hypothetical protein